MCFFFSEFDPKFNEILTDAYTVTGIDRYYLFSQLNQN